MRPMPKNQGLRGAGRRQATGARLNYDKALASQSALTRDKPRAFGHDDARQPIDQASGFDAQSKPTHVEVRAKFDNKEYEVKGAADVKLELAEAQRARRAQYKGQGSMAGGNVTMVAGFDLAPNASGTRVNWQGEAQVFGRLTSVAGGLLEPLGKKQVQKLIDALQAALA